MGKEGEDVTRVTASPTEWWQVETPVPGTSANPPPSPMTSIPFLGRAIGGGVSKDLLAKLKIVQQKAVDKYRAENGRPPPDAAEFARFNGIVENHAGFHGRGGPHSKG